MAWESVCKPGFRTSVLHLTFHKKLSLRSSIKKLAHESGIPVRTLTRWYYEDQDQGVYKNVNTDNPHEITIEKARASSNICRSCGRTVEKFEVVSKTGKPYSEKSKYYQVCVACASRMKRSTRSITTEDDSAMPLVFPHCGQGFGLPWGTVASRYSKHSFNEAGAVQLRKSETSRLSKAHLELL
jgi:hypothetical protein